MTRQGPEHRQSRGITGGIAIGAGFGVALGLVLDNLALGIAIGVALGVALGVAVDQRTRTTPSDAEPRPPRWAVPLGLGLFALFVGAAVLFWAMSR